MKTALPVAPVTAFAVAALGIALFSGMDAVMKGLVLAIGAYNALLWRFGAQTLLSAAVYLPRRPGLPPRTTMRLHLLRGIVAAVMAPLFFWGLARVPMAQAIALAFIAPIIALFLAALILKERVPRGSVIACVMAVGGVALILTGQARAEMGEGALAGTIAILASAVCYAFNIILMRAQSQVAGPTEVTFWQSLIVTAVFLLAAPWMLVVPSGIHAPMLLLAAVLAALSLLALAWAYAHGSASYLAPTEYTGFVWAALFGWLVFGEVLSPWTLAGAALIVAGCFIAARGKPVSIPNIEAAP
ncbi:MAG: DMT family transporter [Pseudomonadota bacterium]